MARVVCMGDGASHPGSINFSGQSGKVKVSGKIVVVAGATFACLVPTHGTTPIAPTTVRSFIEGKLIITDGATAGCGAIMNADLLRNVFAE